MERIWIDNTIVQQHPLWATFNSTLQTLADRDYAHKRYFTNIFVVNALDLDKYEKAQHKSRPQETVDAVIGAKVNVDNRFISPHHVLVELRMGYKYGQNVDYKKVKNKIEHSKEIIGQDYLFGKYAYLVFRNQTIQPAIHYLKRKQLENNYFKSVQVVSVEEFCDNVKQIL